MSEPVSDRRVTPWVHFCRRMLPAYWIFLFCSTHFPGLRLDLNVGGEAKIAHFVAYAILALLFWLFAETIRRPPDRKLVWKAAIVIGAYAAFDEVTQPIMNRSADIWDWFMDLLGMGLVLALLEVRRRRRASRAM